jgi:predicted nucleic acid-binding Zn ribbon protein
MTDRDAEEIGTLYRKAREAIGESDPPLQEGEISQEKCRPPVTDPSVCHWCRGPFKPPKRKRFVIIGPAGNWWPYKLVSICFECFKSADHDEEAGIGLDRVTRDCRGCGEPMSIPSGTFTGCWKPFNWQVCSNRCYQREYRKRRRRNGGSAVEWKWLGTGPSRFRHCEVCDKILPGLLRSDARFCSNRCRQWHYRRRRAAP